MMTLLGPVILNPDNSGGVTGQICFPWLKPCLDVLAHRLLTVSTTLRTTQPDRIRFPLRRLIEAKRSELHIMGGPQKHR